MMRALRVDPLETVSSEEIALRLDQVGGAVRLPVGVEISKRGAERGNRQAGFGCPRDDASEGRMCFLHDGDEGRRHHEIVIAAAGLEHLGDRAEKLRAYDATCPPDLRYRRQGQAPAEFL